MADDEGRDALGRWAPGHTGNPGGRPKGLRRLTDDLYRILAEPATGDELEAMYEALEIPPALRGVIDLAANRQEAFARALVYRMLHGNWAATEEIGDRIDPKPRRQEISGPGGGPVRTAATNLTGSVSAGDAAAAYIDLIRGDPEVADE